MSKTHTTEEITPEQEKELWEKLQEVGEENLSGEDKKKFAELKEKYGEDEEDDDSEDKEAKLPKKTSKTSKKSDAKVQVEAVWRMNSNVKHNGEEFAKDSVIHPNSPHLELFKKNGWVSLNQ